MQTFEPIEKLKAAKEGEHYQFKEARNRFEFDEAARICCALANCGGGKLIFGITDKRPRQVVGSEAFIQPERTRKTLMDKLRINVDFHLYDQEGLRVLAFQVASRPIGLPISLDGIAWWYEGDSLIPMPEKVRKAIYNESGFDFSGSICKGACLEDLDDEAVDQFRKQWMLKRDNNHIRNLTKEQLLSDCTAITDEGITYAALILFGTKASLNQFLPQAEIIFEYRSTEASGPAGQREEFRVGFFNCYNRLWDLINLRNEKQHYQEGFIVYDIPTFNERVVREAILNAVSHRNYQLAGSIFINQHPSKLRIVSPGGLPHGITLDNILDRQSPRNRRIAEILALCGLVERSGQGMNLIYELSIKEAKALPDFTGTDEHLVSITLDGLMLDKMMLSLINEIGNAQMESLSTDDFLIIDALYHEKHLARHLRPRLKRLASLGIVEQVSKNKYVLARRLYSASGKPGVHTRVAGLDRDTNKELILKHIRRNGKIGTPLRELTQVLPGHSRGQLQALLRELKQDELIYLVGRTSAARWFAH